jgi:Ni/Co efflux regulator RcnB
MRSVLTALVSASLLATSLLAGAPASADPRNHGDRAVTPSYGHRGGDERGGPERSGRGYGAYGSYGRDYGRRGHDEGWHHRYEPYRGHDWRRGERLGYYAPRVWVPDYAVYHLRPPPPGCEWVRVGDDVLLTAIATGVVIDVVHHLFG